MRDLVKTSKEHGDKLRQDDKRYHQSHQAARRDRPDLTDDQVVGAPLLSA